MYVDGDESGGGCCNISVGPELPTNEGVEVKGGQRGGRLLLPVAARVGMKTAGQADATKSWARTLGCASYHPSPHRMHKRSGLSSSSSIDF